MSGLLDYVFQCPMGLWSRSFSFGSRGTSDVQQWLRNRSERSA